MFSFSNTLFSFFLFSHSFLLPLLSQVAVSGQPCPLHIGVSSKTDDINRGMHTCTCVQARPFPDAHIPSLIPGLSMMMAWEMCASVQQQAVNKTNPPCSCRPHYLLLPPSLTIGPLFLLPPTDTFLVYLAIPTKYNPSFTRGYLFLYVPSGCRQIIV